MCIFRLKDWIYKQSSCPQKFQYKYIRDYFEGNKNYNKFGVVFHNVMHNQEADAENIDDDTAIFLKRN